MVDGMFFFEDEPVNVAPRLFRQPPAGLGGNAESLISYLKRLAHKHRMSPRGFVEEHLGDEGQDHEPISLARDWLHRNGQDLVGVSDRAATLADWFARNTGVSEVLQCGLSNLSPFICGQRLVTRESRVCLQCFDEDRREGRPMFERLLWRLEPVTVCDKHCCPLIAPRCQGERASHRSSPANLPGVCLKCGSIGLKCSSEEEVAECTDADLWVARQCRRLVEALPSLKGADPIRMKASLRAHCMSGKGIVSAAKSLDMTPSSFSVWLRLPKSKCLLFRLIDISLTQQLDLVALLRGELEKCDLPMDRRPRTGKRAYQLVDHATLKQRLAAALEAGECVASVAREMKVSHCALKTHAALYIRVRDQARTARDSKETERRRAAVRQAEEVVIRLLRKRKVPSLRNASTETNEEWRSSLLKSAALTSMRVQLGDAVVREPSRKISYSAELRQMIAESVQRIQQQFQ